jgi:hypothetical protein
MPSSAACDAGHRDLSEVVRRANLQLEDHPKIRNVSQCGAQRDHVSRSSEIAPSVNGLLLCGDPEG